MSSADMIWNGKAGTLFVFTDKAPLHTKTKLHEADVRTRLRNNDINLRWDSIRNRMESWRRVTTTQQTPIGQQVVLPGCLSIA